MLFTFWKICQDLRSTRKSLRNILFIYQVACGVLATCIIISLWLSVIYNSLIPKYNIDSGILMLVISFLHVYIKEERIDITFIHEQCLKYCFLASRIFAESFSSEIIKISSIQKIVDTI